VKRHGVTGENLLRTLELRMDNIVFRLGFADSRPQPASSCCTGT